MWANFQVKTLKYGFTAKAGFYRENSLKIRYLARNKLAAGTLFRVFTVH
jgi:hypothetical protein